MSILLRLNPSTSYLPLPQNGHIEDENDPGKETVQSSRRQGERYLWLPWLQLAIVVVLLLLAGIAGFFIGLSLPQSRLASSSLPDTVPRGSLCSRISHMQPAKPVIFQFSPACPRKHSDTMKALQLLHPKEEVKSRPGTL